MLLSLCNAVALVTVDISVAAARIPTYKLQLNFFGSTAAPWSRCHLAGFFAVIWTTITDSLWTDPNLVDASVSPIRI